MRQAGTSRAGSSRQAGSTGGGRRGGVRDHTSCAGAVITTVASSRKNAVKGSGSTSTPYLARFRSTGRTSRLSDAPRVTLRVILGEAA
jgi:hypothetical protein